MSDVQMTLHGFVGGEVEFKNTGRGDLASFRVASTPRFRDGQGGWRNGETTWTQIAAWRTLAANVAASISVGDPVVVIGRLRTSRWTTPDGEPRERSVLDATTVAHDLARGTSVFRKNQRPAQREDDEETVNAVLDRVEQVPPNIDPTTGEIRGPSPEPSGEPSAGPSQGPQQGRDAAAGGRDTADTETAA